MEFLEGAIERYKDGRDIPSEQNTSMLSPHLAFGEISPQQIWHDTMAAMAANQIDSNNGEKFLSEIGWREFARYLLVHFPHIVDQPFNRKFENFPWQGDSKSPAGLATRSDRLSDCRCRHARIMANRIYA